MKIKSPFWTILTLQIISFLIMFLFEIAHLGEVYLQAPFLIIELGILAIFLFEIDKKYFYMMWQFQVYLVMVFKILFRYEESFSGNFTITAAGTMIFLLTFIETMIIAGFIFKERAVKPILFTLSSTTSVAVILIIFFIFREGIPAFVENDPVEFVTGASWDADYEIYKDDTIFLTFEIIDYDHEISFPDTRVYMGSGITNSVNLTLTNSGSKADTYSIDLTQNGGIDVILNCSSIHLDPKSIAIIPVYVTPLDEGEQEIEVTVRSINGSKIIPTSVTIVAGIEGIDVWPEIIEYTASDFDIARIPVYFKNTGSETETYRLTVDFDEEYMRSSVERTGEDWNYDTNSVNVTLEPGETLDGMLLPRLFQTKNAIFQLGVTATSLSNPSVQDDVVVNFEYRDFDFIDIKSRSYTIDVGDTIQVPFCVNVSNFAGTNFTLGIKDYEGPLESFSIRFSNLVIDEKEDYKIIDLSEGGIQQVELEITSSSSSVIGENITIEMVVGRSATEPSFGIGPMIAGTILVVIIALVIAVPLGLGAAIFLAEYCPRRLHSILRPLFELLAGIPSIVYGLWGYFTLAPFFRDHINNPVSDTIGRLIPFFSVTSNTPSAEGTLAVAGLVLAIMILPIIITLSEDSMRAVSRNLKEGSLALATTKWQTIKGVILRKARSGIISSIILAMGRAIGETMAVVMILRMTTTYPGSIFERAGSMTGTIAQTFGWSFDLDRSRHAVFGIAIILFIMVFSLNIIVYYLQYSSKRKGKKPLDYLALWVGKILDRKRKVNLDSKGLYNSVKEMTSSYRMISPRWNHLKETFSKGFMVFSAGLIVIFLLLVLSDVIITGISSMKLNYLYERELAGGIQGGGFANAIIGSIQLTGLTLLISIPFSVGAAIYVQQYTGEGNFFTKIILFASDTLASTPSIVFGAFGFIFFSMELKFGLSVLAAALTLAIMVIPLLLRSSIEALKSIPKEMGEGSLALGASKWQTIWHVILPPAMGGITSGIILSIGRAIGETAAILFTAGYALGYNNSIMSPIATMPNMIYNYYGLSAHAPELRDKIYSCAFVLILMILVFNSIARIFQYRSKKMMKGGY